MATLAVNENNLERIRAGRTIKDFAAELSVDASTVSRLVSGKAEPGPRIIAALLDTYPYPFDYFFRVTDAA
ncbi:helix-turn-helix transcriptional regulator [Cryobacterium sp. Hh11]|uniref:helix-turn-helix domain-containing protein n=1 Tax=Cryobacterium sp. Hh11 TaxID=2555868 RepID=UPI00141BBBE3|nr:helix-turn-helix transcriptional regulator [Cryobacterium sp. Hh11]